MTVSEEMVEIAAKAMHARLRKEAWWPDPRGGGSWDEEPGTYQIDASAKDRYRANARAALTAALSDQVVVPKEPTPEMIGAWYRHKNGFHFAGDPPPRDTSDYGAYCAMIAAAPSTLSGNEPK